MKQKLRKLSAPANIIFAILAVFIFIAPLQWSGKVLGLIPGMEKADDYLLQAIVETAILVIFLGITYLFGLWDIFKENAAGWTRSLYTGGFFIVYCMYAVFSGIYLCFLSVQSVTESFSKDERWNHRSRSFGRHTVWIDAFFKYGRRG